MAAIFDEAWLRAAAAVGLPVVRGGDAYVHFDGATLHLCTDEHLDQDDTVGQLVLHELCHALVQGERNRHVVDWGMDNTVDRDDDQERAAIRLQAHLAGGWGLRGVLFPTTIWRSYYLALGDDALAGDDDPARLSRVAARHAAERPWGPALQEALAETARLAGRPSHPRSGLPMPPVDEGVVPAPARRCGDCGFRAPSGLCRKAPRRVYVQHDTPACARWEVAPDCLACGACCRSAYDAVEVGPREAVRRLRPDYVVERDGRFGLRRAGDRCAALAGPEGGPFHCVIYDDRPRTCHHFERAGRHCLEARRKVGLSL